jgi:hypothetical protein
MRLAPSKMSSESSVLPRGWNEKITVIRKIESSTNRQQQGYANLLVCSGQEMWWVHREIAKSAAKTL